MSPTCQLSLNARIVVSDVSACYSILDLLRTLFDVKWVCDYVKTPKLNGYRSLHCVIHCRGTLLEVQLRTLEMHVEAEKGCAAHLKYKTRQLDECLSLCPCDIRENQN